MSQGFLPFRNRIPHLRMQAQRISITRFVYSMSRQEIRRAQINLRKYPSHALFTAFYDSTSIARWFNSAAWETIALKHANVQFADVLSDELEWTQPVTFDLNCGCCKQKSSLWIAVLLLRCMEKPQKSTTKKEKTRVEQRLNGIWLRHKSSRYDYQSNRNAGVQISIFEICPLFFKLMPIFDDLRKKCAVYASIMPPHWKFVGKSKYIHVIANLDARKNGRPKKWPLALASK